MINQLASEDHRGTEVLAAFALTDVFQSGLLTGLTDGFATATDMLCSQAYGASRHRDLWLVLQAALILDVASMPLVFAMLGHSETILVTLGQDPQIAAITAKLLVANGLAFPFSVLFSITRSALQAQNTTAPLLTATIAAWTLSLPIGYALGCWSSLGYMAVVLSVVLVSLFKLLAMVPVVRASAAFVQAWPGWRLQAALAHVPRLVFLGASSVLMLAFQMLGITVISPLAGLLPDAAIEIVANSIFTNTFTIVCVPVVGLGTAGGIRISNALGAGDGRRASLVSRLVIVGTLGLAITGSVCSQRITGIVGAWLTEDKPSITLAESLGHELLPIMPVFGLVSGIQTTLCAGGKQWLCALLSGAFQLGLSVLLGLIFGVTLDWGIVGLWMGLLVGMSVYVLVAGAWVWCRLDWDNMAKEVHQLHNDTLCHEDPPAAFA